MIATRPIAPAVFAGVQHCSGIMPDFELWTLTVDIPGHCAGSSIDGKSIEAAGYELPPKLTPEQERRRRAWYGRPESMDSRHPFLAEGQA